MLRKTLFASLIASSALTLALASPVAAADKGDRAREAIAAAEAKLNTADSLGAGTDSPADAAQAHALLATAKEDFAAGHKGPAIQEAIQASALADTVIGRSQQHKEAALRAAHESERATADAARDQITAAQGQAAAAQNQSVAAQQQAADANARAQAAQQSAAASAAEAADARNAAAMAAAQTPPPAPQVETTVTTQQQASNTHHVIHKKVVRSTTTTGAAPTTTDEVTTTTKVTPQR